MKLHVKEEGSLKRLINERPSKEILLWKLTLSGDLCGEDIETLQNLNDLKFLNLKEANITGGDYKVWEYYDDDEEDGGWEYYEINKNHFHAFFDSFNRSYEIGCVILPDSVIDIQPCAFRQCSELKIVVIGEQTKQIDDYAFLDCHKIKEIYCLNPEPPYTSDKLFAYTDSNEEITLFVPIGSGEKYKAAEGWRKAPKIEESDFAELYNDMKTMAADDNTVDDEDKEEIIIDGTAVIVPDSLTEIYTADLPEDMESITFGKSIDEAPYLTEFYSLKEIIVSEENEDFSSLDGVLYNKDQTRLIFAPCALGVEEFHVPESVTEIDEDAMGRVDGLKAVYFHSDEVPDLEADNFPWFAGEGAGTIYVPEHVLWDYKEAGGYWEDYADDIQPIPEEDGNEESSGDFSGFFMSLMADFFSRNEEGDEEEDNDAFDHDFVFGSEDDDKSSGKNYSKYIFRKETYNKGRLVNAVIRQVVKDRKIVKYSTLEKHFPRAIQGSMGVFAPKEVAVAIYDRTKKKRYHIKDDEVIVLGNGTEICTCNQWTPKNIRRFIKAAKSLGYGISEKE